MSHINKAVLEIYIVGDNDDPLTFIGDIAKIKQLIDDIKYSIEYSGGRKPLVQWENEGTVTYINPAKISFMEYSV